MFKRQAFEIAAKEILASGDDLCIPAVPELHWLSIESDEAFDAWLEKYFSLSTEERELPAHTDEDGETIKSLLRSHPHRMRETTVTLKGDEYEALSEFGKVYAARKSEYRHVAYIGTAFSPSMLGEGSAVVYEVVEKRFVFLFNRENRRYGVYSIVGHKNTAEVLSRRLNLQIPFNRETISLVKGQKLFVAVPQARFDEAREFTDEEIRKAPFRFFVVEVK